MEGDEECGVEGGEGGEEGGEDPGEDWDVTKWLWNIKLKKL